MSKLTNVEADIMKTLDYRLNEWTFFDIASISVSSFKNEFMLKVLEYICRLVVIQYEFYSRQNPSLIGQACAWVVHYIFNKSQPLWMNPSSSVQNLGFKIFGLISGFRSVHSHLKNADQFTDPAVVEEIFDFLEKLQA